MKIVLITFFSLIIFSVLAQDNNTPVSFTLGDRDRLMRNEQNIISLQKKMNTRFESVDIRFESIDKRFDNQQKQLDNIFTLMLFLLGGIMGLIGFVIYDRRTAIKPVQREQETILKVLKEYSEKHTDLNEILKKAGIVF